LQGPYESASTHVTEVVQESVPAYLVPSATSDSQCILHNYVGQFKNIRT